MGVKKGHPLREIEELPQAVVEQLHGLSISTAEEFISQEATSPEGLASYLDVSLPQLEELVEFAENYVEADFVETVRQHEPERRALGARSPYSDEFLKLRAGRHRD